MTRGRVVVTSDIPAPAEQVWTRAVSAEGVNHELGPWLRMTVPAGLRGMTVETAPTNTPLGRSWILLFGVVPVDYDDLCLAELGPGYRFLERSSTASMRLWSHERVIEPADRGARVTDTLTFEPRAATRLLPRPFVAAIVRALFKHRHRRLLAYFS